MFRYCIALLGMVVTCLALGQETPPRAEQKIRDALRGKSLEPTGDGMLDDVIEIVRRRGSVLDGSVLDGDMLDTSEQSLPNRDSAEPRSSGQNFLHGGGTTARAIRSRRDIENRAAAAEQLLRAARLLMQTGDADASRRELVAQMRAEAVKLLSQADPVPVDPVPVDPVGADPVEAGPIAVDPVEVDRALAE